MEDLNYEMKIRNNLERISGQSNQFSPTYQRLPMKKNNPKLKNFRLGEILQGKILNIKNDFTGLVRLPSGDFDCHLHKGLLPEDELFFIIASVEPSLVLKVHAVQSFFKGKKRKREDIVRILDLPQQDIYFYTADVFLTYKNLIYKEDVIRFFRFYIKTPNYQNLDEESISRTLFWLSESGLSFEYDIFQMAYRYFEGLKSIDFEMNKLFNFYIEKLPVTLKNILLPFKNKYLGIVKTDNFNLDFFSDSKDGEGINFFKIIRRIADSGISEIIDDNPKRIAGFIQALHFWNDVCKDSEAAYHWTFPSNLIKSNNVLTLVFKSQFNIQKILYDTPNFPDNNLNIDVGKVLSQIINRNNETINIELSTIQNINILMNYFGKYLSQIGLSLIALQYFDGSLKTIEAPGGSTMTTNKSISFVV
jgi:hypothetical protein